MKADDIAEESYVIMEKENKKQFKKIADDAIEYALVYLEELQEIYGGTDFFFDEKEKEKIKEELTADKEVEKVVKSYNIVTGYLYDREQKRKQARLKEGMMAAKKAEDRDFYKKTIKTNTDLWYTQSKQYAEDIADNTVLDVWKVAGVTKIKWVTMRDEKVCKECGPLDGKIFDIDKVPPKPHYRCRCLKVPVVIKGINTDKGE